MRANQLNNQQKNKLRDLKGIVGGNVPDDVLVGILKQQNWNTNAAMDAYFSGGYE